MRKSGRYVFLPNINNKFSIRKFTVGTASILVGTTLIFGVSHNEVKAEEQINAEKGLLEVKNKDLSTEESAAPAVEKEEGSTEESAAPAVEKEEGSTEESAALAVEKEEGSTEESAAPAVEKEERSTEESAAPAVEKEEGSTEESAALAVEKEEGSTEESAAPAVEKEERSTEESAAPAVEKEEGSTEESAAPAVEKEEGSTEESAAPAVEKEERSTEESAAPAVEKEEGSTEESAAPAVEKEERSTEESAAPAVEKEEGSTEESAAPAVEKEEGSTEESKAAPVVDKAESTPESSNVEDSKDDSVDIIDEVSKSDAQQAIEGLNLNTDNLTSEELQAALMNQLANEQNVYKTLATNTNITSQNEESIALASNEALTTLVNNTTSQVIEADAIANGYINSNTDATNARNTLSGRAWVVDMGTPSTMTNGLTPVPEGTKVYLQWIDKDGAVSPTYVAKTTNQLSRLDASQVGPGTYAFDLREGWTDVNGKKHVYNATSGQYYRLWIEDYQTEEGNTATMIRQAGGFFPGSFVNSVTSSNIGQFPLIGTNMQRTGVYMGIEPSNNYMTTDDAQWIHDEEGPLSNPSVSLNARNTISGQVWIETGAGDLANSSTGPNNNANDPEAQGYTVVMSSLTEEGATEYKNKVANLPKSERGAAAKALLTSHPEYISATVYGETDEQGRYTLRFPEGTLNTNYIYGYVMNPEGDIVSAYSSYTTPEFRSPNYNLSWAPQTAPAQNLVQNPMWYNVNFALVPKNDLDIDILDYNNTDHPAIVGDEVHIDLIGAQLSPLPTHVEWRDKNGNVIQRTGDISSLTDGEQKGTFIVPDTAQDGDTYTAVIVVGGNDIAADSFIVKFTEKHSYEPTTEGVEKPYGEAPTEEEVTGSVTVPGYPEDGEQPVITVDDPTKLPDGKTPGTTNVEVTVTYPDGTVDHIEVPVTVGDQADNEANEPTTEGVEKPYGEAPTEEEVTGSVTVPGYPEDGEQPVITVDDPTKLPDGKTPGTTNVGVTVTYPDGTVDHIEVPVTVGDQADNEANEPTTEGVEKPYGEAPTEEEVTGSVTVPGYPEDGEQPVITVDDPTKLPDGKTPGTTNVGVTVTYPDGTVDHIEVPVTVGEQADNEANEPTTEGVEKPYGEAPTEEEVTGSVTVPGYPEDEEQPVITVDDPTKLPDGKTPGTTNVGVTVTYPDGTVDHIEVPVTVGEQADNEANEPTTEGVEKPYGEAPTEEEVTGSVTVPGYPEDGEQPVITVDDPTKLPDGKTPGTTNVGVTVTYPDGTVDHIEVPVTVGEQADNEANEPTTEGVEKPYGEAPTEEEVTGSVTVPGYPEDGEQPVITVDDPTKLPDGKTPGTTNVGVTVTYPDGTVDHIEVPVTVGDQADNDFIIDGGSSDNQNVISDKNSNGTTESNGNVTSNVINNKENNSQKSDYEQKAKALPETGESNQGTIWGAMFAAIGSLLLFRRRKNNREDQ